MKSRSKEEVLSEIQGAVATFRSKMAEMPAEDPKLKMMQKVMADLDPVLALADPDLDQLLTLSSMAMENWLDARLGAGVTDHSIFAALTQYWEGEYWKDMGDLGVLPPDVLTRVT